MPYQQGSAATARELRSFAAAVGSMMIATAWVAGLHGMALAALVLAAVVSVLAAWLRPQWLQPAWSRWRMITSPVRWLANEALLVLLYFGLLTPAAWLSRAAGRDPLRLRPPEPDPSHESWIPCADNTDRERLFRMF